MSKILQTVVFIVFSTALLPLQSLYANGDLDIIAGLEEPSEILKSLNEIFYKKKLTDADDQLQALTIIKKLPIDDIDCGKPLSSTCFSSRTRAMNAFFNNLRASPVNGRELFEVLLTLSLQDKPIKDSDFIERSDLAFALNDLAITQKHLLDDPWVLKRLRACAEKLESQRDKEWIDRLLDFVSKFGSSWREHVLK